MRSVRVRRLKIVVAQFTLLTGVAGVSLFVFTQIVSSEKYFVALIAFQLEILVDLIVRV